MSSTSYKVKLLTSAFGNGVVSRDGEDIAFRCPSCTKSGSSKKKLAINNINTDYCNSISGSYKNSLALAETKLISQKL